MYMWIHTCSLVELCAISILNVLLLYIKLWQRNLIHLNRVSRLPHKHQVLCGIANYIHTQKTHNININMSPHPYFYLLKYKYNSAIFFPIAEVPVWVGMCLFHLQLSNCTLQSWVSIGNSARSRGQERVTDNLKKENLLEFSFIRI